MFSIDDYNKRYLRLKEMSLNLDADPAALGLHSLTTKLAQIQDLRNRVGVALAEAIQNKSEVEIEHHTIKHQLEARLDGLMMTDEEVRGQKSEKLREAVAQTKATDLVLQMHYKEVDFVRASAYEKFVKQIHDTLEAANTNLSRQISVIQMSIQLGEIDSSLLPGTLTLKNGS